MGIRIYQPYRLRGAKGSGGARPIVRHVQGRIVLVNPHPVRIPDRLIRKVQRVRYTPIGKPVEKRLIVGKGTTVTYPMFERLPPGGRVIEGKRYKGQLLAGRISPGSPEFIKKKKGGK